MPEVKLDANKKGAVGEALVLGGQFPPKPVKNTVESFIFEQYNVVREVGLDLSFRPAELIRVTIDNDRWVSWEPDAVLEAKWVPVHHQDEVEFDDGDVVNYWELPKESARFPVEVKTGEHAEFERGQKETIESIVIADNQVHPVLVRVSIDELPEACTVKTDFF